MTHVNYNGPTTIGYQQIGDIYNQTISHYSEEYISISRINNMNNKDAILEEITSAILVAKLGQDFQDTPFIYPRDFDNIRIRNKLLLYGRSGCGKSRTIIEIMKDKLEDFQNIYVINPKSVKAVQQVKLDDLVWDNFPDRLIEGDIIESAIRALARVSSANVKNIFVALNPLFNEPYEKKLDQIHYLYKYEMTFDIHTIKNIVDLYQKSY
jgi:Cdc6-like AAA superfamily ATPase